MTTFGDLRIVASTRTKEAGPVESEPVLYHWPWYWHLPRLAPWALLALAIAVPRRNRDRQALLIFVPLAILGLAWPMIARRASLPSGSADQFAALFGSLAAGLALLWLNADVLRKYHVLVRFPMSLGLLLLAGAVVIVSSGWAADPSSVILLFVIGVLGVILLAALALARRLTRRRYAPLRFMLWLAAGSLLLTTAGLVSYLMTVTLLLVPGSVTPGSLLGGSVRIGLVLGLCLYAVNLPYMLLMFTSPFFRQRFQTWLGMGASS